MITDLMVPKHLNKSKERANPRKQLNSVLSVESFRKKHKQWKQQQKDFHLGLQAACLVAQSTSLQPPNLVTLPLRSFLTSMDHIHLPQLVVPMKPRAFRISQFCVKSTQKWATTLREEGCEWGWQDSPRNLAVQEVS